MFPFAPDAWASGSLIERASCSACWWRPAAASPAATWVSVSTTWCAASTAPCCREVSRRTRDDLIHLGLVDAGPSVIAVVTAPKPVRSVVSHCRVRSPEGASGKPRPARWLQDHLRVGAPFDPPISKMIMRRESPAQLSHQGLLTTRAAPSSVSPAPGVPRTRLLGRPLRQRSGSWCPCRWRRWPWPALQAGCLPRRSGRSSPPA